MAETAEAQVGCPCGATAGSPVLEDLVEYRKSHIRIMENCKPTEAEPHTRSAESERNLSCLLAPPNPAQLELRGI
jgi:hypothetical protein